MKNLFSLYISVLCLFTLALYGCGDDNPTNNNNNGGNGSETVLYSRDTFSVQTSQQGNFYLGLGTGVTLDSGQYILDTVKLTFTVTHNLDSTSSTGRVYWSSGANYEDSLRQANMLGTHSVIFKAQTLLGNYEIDYGARIYHSSTNLLKYIKFKDIKLTKVN